MCGALKKNYHIFSFSIDVSGEHLNSLFGVISTPLKVPKFLGTLRGVPKLVASNQKIGCSMIQPSLRTKHSFKFDLYVTSYDLK